MRTKKAVKNMAAAMAYQIVAIVCGLITPRLILANFGSTYNGVINSATQFLSMINILTLGITGATRVELYKTLAKEDTLGTSRIMKATKRYMRKVGLCVILYAIVLCLIYPYISHNSLTRAENALIICIVSIGTFAQYFFGISNRTLLQADQASYVSYLLDIFKIIVNTICVVILIQLGGNIYVVKLGSSIVYLITPAVMELLVRKKYHLINDCEPDNTGIEQRGAVAFLSIANLVHNNVDLVLLTLFTDAKMISVYTVYYLVVGKIKQLMMIVMTGMEAAFGNMWAKGEMEALQRNFRGLEYVIYTFTAIVFSCVGILILPFIERYTAGIRDVNYVRLDLAILITFAEAFYCFRQPYLTLVQAAGHYKETKNGSAVEAIINLTVSLILVNFIGISGVIIGTLAANIFRTTQYGYYISKHILGRSFMEIVRRVLWTLGCGTMICVICIPLQSRMVFATGWGGWVCEATLVFAISCICVAIMSILFYRSDVTFILNAAMRMSRPAKNENSASR